MTKFTALALGILFVLASLSIAEARHNDGLEGFIIGGAGGAVIGHVATGTPEGVIVGSLLGSTIGMMIDISDQRNHVVYVDHRHRHHRHGYYDRGHRSHRGHKHYYGRHDHKRWNRWDTRWDNRWDNHWDNRRDHRGGKHHRW